MIDNQGVPTGQRSELFVIGSPIVDILAKVKQSLINKAGLQKGLLCILEPEAVREISKKIEISKRILGGSASNTAVGAANLGSNVVFAGKHGKDDLGDFVGSSLQKYGVRSACTAEEGLGGTTCVYILISEDGERTMLPIYGASRYFTLDKEARQLVADSKLVFADAYQFDAPATEQAVLDAFELVQANCGKSVLTLSDPNCVNLYRNKLLRALPTTSILFGNEDELKLLFDIGKTQDLMAVLRQECIAGHYKFIVSTRNKDGSVTFTDKGEIIFNKPVKVDKVVDQTGAGDLFAAGFLHAYLKGYELDVCGKVGSLVAAKVVQQVGAVMGSEIKEEVRQFLYSV